MVSWLEAYVKEVLKNKNGAFGSISNSRCKFTLTDIILISKNFKKDDIDYLVNKIDLRNIPFDEVNKLEEHIQKQIESYQNMFGETLTGGDIFVWKFYSEEIKILLSIAPYFVTNNECKLIAVKFIIDMADGYFYVSDRIRIINKWMRISNVKDSSSIVENWFLNKITPILKNQIAPIGIEQAINDATMIAQLLANVITVDIYNIDVISKLIIDNKDNEKCIKNCFESLYPALNDEAKKIVDSIHVIENVFQLMQRSYFGKLPDNCNEFQIVEDYLEKILKERQANKEK